VIRVIVVDDHPLFRQGVVGLLATVPDVEVVASSADGESGVRQSIELRPDVVLMDLNLPDLPGLEATRRIAAAAPEVAVLVLTMVDDDDSVLATLRVGARGYILKGADQDEVLAAIRAVAAGGAVFGRSIAERVLHGGRGPGRDLTKREAEVLSGIARGLSNPQIANELGVSVKTVQNHASRVLAKLQVTDRTQAALRMRGLRTRDES
jgi:DNA-binding NarL/FixJ family response regulator